MGQDSDPAYLDFFGMTRSPFARLSAPSEIFYSDQCSLLHSHLSRASEQSDTLLVICGADGSGKTTLLNQYIAGLDEDLCYAAFDEHCQDGTQFYCSFLRQLGFGEITGTLRELRRIAREFIVNRGRAGEVVLFFLDNAHLVRPEVLEQLRWIADTRVDERRVLSVVVAGNLNLRRIMDSPAMSSVQFENHINFTIRVYTEVETEDYVRHRLRLAGAADVVQFAEGARSLIYRFSGGVPRQINRLCDAVLADAKANGEHQIDEQLIRSVADSRKILPHIVPLQGKGRRKTDPDPSQSAIDAQDEERISARKAGPHDAGTDESHGKGSADLQALLAQVAHLTQQLQESKTQIIQTRQISLKKNSEAEGLRAELAAKVAEAEGFAAEAAKRAKEVGQLSKSLLESRDILREHDVTSRALTTEITSLREQLKAAETESARLASTIGDKEEKIDCLSQLLADSQKGLQDSEAFVDQLTADLDLLKNAGTDDIIKDLRKQLDAQRQESEALTASAASKTDEIIKLRDALEETTTALEQGEQSAAALAGDVEKLEGQLAAKDKESVELLSTIEGHEADIEVLTQSLADSVAAQREQEMATLANAADLESLHEKLATRDEESLKLAASIEKYEEEIAELTAALGQREEALLTKEQDAEDSASELKQLQDELASKTAQADELAGTVAQHANDIEALNLSLAQSEKSLLESEKALKTQAIELDALQQSGSDKVISDLREQLSAQEKETEKLSAAVEKHATETGRLTESLAAKENALKESDQASKALAAEIKSLQKQLAKKEKGSDKLAKSVSKKDEEISRLNEALSASKVTLQTNEKDLQALGADVGNLKKELTEKGKQSDQLAARVLQGDEDIARLTQTVADGRDTLRLSEKTAKTFAAGLLKFQKQLAAKESESAQLTEQINRYNEEVAQLTRSLEDSATALHEEKVAAKTQAKELEKVQKEISARNQELQTLTERFEQRDQEASRLKQELDETNSELRDKGDAARLYADELEKSQEEFAAKDEEYRSLEAKVSQYDEDMAQLAQSLSATEAALQEKDQASQKIAAELEERHAELAAKIADAEQLTATIGQHDEKIAGLTAELADSRKALTEQERSADELIDDLRSQLETQVSEAETAAASTAAEIRELKESLADQSKLLQESEETARTLAGDIENWQEEFESKDAAAEFLENTVKRNEGEIEKLNSALTDSEERLLEREKEAKRLAAEVKRLEESEELVATLRDEVAVQSSELQELTATVAANSDEIDQLSESLANKTKALKESEVKLQQLEASIEEERIAAKRASTESAKAQKRFDKLDSENTELQITIDQLRSELESGTPQDSELELLEMSLEEAQQENAELHAELKSLKSQGGHKQREDTRAAVAEMDIDDADPGDTTATLKIILDESPEPAAPPATKTAAVLPMQKKKPEIAAIDIYRNGLMYQVWDMSKGPARIMVGRAEDCELRLVSKYISRHHATLFTSGEHVYIEDLNSFNGVVVNTEKVSRHQLKSDDNIVIGEYNLIPRAS